MTLTTRKPTGLPPWPMLLLAGCEKGGKSYSAAALSASDLIDRTIWIEVGEGAADQYGAIPGARYEIAEHDGSFRDILRTIRATTTEPADNKPHAIVIDSMTELWDLLVAEQQEAANKRRKKDEAPIGMDQWNTAKKRWRAVIDSLRAHNGPVILTARLEQVAVVVDGTPTAEKAWKIRAEKNLPFEVDGIIEIPKPRDYYLTGVRSTVLQVDPGGHMPLPDFTIDGLLRALGLDTTSPRAFTAPDPTKASTTDEAWLATTREWIEAATTKAEFGDAWTRLRDGLREGRCTDVDHAELEALWKTLVAQLPKEQS